MTELPRFAWLARAYGIWLFSQLACITVLTHVAQLSGWSFRGYAIAGAIVTVSMAAGLAALGLHSWRSRLPEFDGAATAVALVAALTMAALALFSARANSDDNYYIPNAVHALANPGESLGFVVHGLVLEGREALVSYNWISGPYELGQAIVAHWLGLEFLAVYYLIAPVFAAFAMACSLLYLASLFRLSPLSTSIGCAVALVLLLSMGETNRAFGNFSVTRAFQGKTLLLSAGIPFLAAATIEYFRRPSLATWAWVALVSTALVGASTSSIVLVPLFAPLLIGALFVADRDPALLRRLPGYFAAHLYLIGYGLAYLATGYSSKLGAASPVNQFFPSDFSGHLLLMGDPLLPLTPIVLGSAGVVCAVLAPPRVRAFLLGWVALAVSFYLNPWAAPFLIEHVTSPNIYWRLFYLLPVTLLPALAVALLLERLRARSAKVGYFGAVAFLLAGAVALHVAFPRATVLRSAALGWPRYNLNPLYLASARVLTSGAYPAGPMLAPGKIAGIVPMLAAAYPQLLLRYAAETIWLGGGQGRLEADWRNQAMNFAAGKGGSEFALLRVAERLPLRTLVLRQGAWIRLSESGGADRLLKLGFAPPVRNRGLLILTREGGR